MLVLKYLESARWFHRVSPNFLGLLSPIHDRSTIRPGSSMMGTSSRQVVYCVGAKKHGFPVYLQTFEPIHWRQHVFLFFMDTSGKPILSRWVEPKPSKLCSSSISDLLPPNGDPARKRISGVTHCRSNNSTMNPLLDPSSPMLQSCGAAIGASLFVGTARPSPGDFLCAFHVGPFRIYLKCTP